LVKHLTPLLALPVLAIAALAITSCRSPNSGSSGAEKLPPPQLDAVYSSPTGLYTIRYNHNWLVQQLGTQGGIADFFKLADETTFAVVMDRVLPGTSLERMVQSTVSQYRDAHVQGLERIGTVNVGGGKGVLLHALTYVTPEGLTSMTPPSPGAKPRNLYQVFYLAGDQSFTFSIAWPQTDKTDYLTLFRSMLQTFTLAGTT
jgi:hypothetical protein